MRLTVQELERFYQSPRGAAAQAMIARRIGALWPQLNGLDVLGLGFAEPFLDTYRAGARRVVSASPAAQGARPWPSGAPNVRALAVEHSLPFPDAAFDRILIAHLLEEADALSAAVMEASRALAPSGRIMILAAHRAGLWCRAERTPFGHGRSFSRGQVSRLLDAAGLSARHWARALFMPPVAWTPVTRSALTWERMGERAWPALGGVVLVEASRHTPARIGVAARQPVFQPLGAPVGEPRPAWRV